MGSLPNSVREINSLDLAEKQDIYKMLIPDWIYSDFGLVPELVLQENKLHILCPTGSRAMELSIRRDAADRDPIMYINIADTFNHQILVLLVVVNDPDAPRFNVDVDQHGNRTNFGTTTRNIAAERAAMNAGLAPGQIRKGLRAFKRSMPILETFITNMDHDIFLIEPLAYHNAIIFERYGFNYMRGLKDMRIIHEEFQPGGALYAKLTPDNPFRQVGAADTIRGRSWAIHDGILGYPYTGFQMYKRVGKDAGVNTFPDASW